MEFKQYNKNGVLYIQKKCKSCVNQESKIRYKERYLPYEGMYARIPDDNEKAWRYKRFCATRERIHAEMRAQ
jgi:hypothetical protein